MTDANHWLHSLNVGDQVIITERGDSKHIARVERVTKSTVTAGGIRFRRETGDRIGGSSWDSCEIIEATPERLQRFRQLVARRRAIVDIRTATDRLFKTKLPTDVLQQIAAALKPLLDEGAP